MTTFRFAAVLAAGLTFTLAGIARAADPISFTSFEVPGAVPGALTSSSINDEGVVVGFYDTAAGTTVGFIRSRLGVLTAPVVAPYDNVTNTLLHSVNDEGV